jgi:hypothetical protein
MTMERIGYDSLYKRALGTARQLVQFLQAFDPQTAGLLRLDTIEPRGTELFDVLPAWYRRVADIVAQVEARGEGQELLLIHVEVQRTKQQHFGQRMLDYYTLLRRSTSLPVLPYAVLLYRCRPALGYKTYSAGVLMALSPQIAKGSSAGQRDLPTSITSGGGQQEPSMMWIATY